MCILVEIFLLRSVAFLGHIISSEVVEVDPRKMQVVNSCPRPLSPTDIRSFLVLVGDYRRFVNGFSSNTSPLMLLTQNSFKLEWLESCERNFQLLKDRLS